MRDIIFYLHMTSLTFVAWNVFQADHMGFSWMKGRVETLPLAKVRKYHIQMWIGLILMIITGLLLFWPVREYLLSRPQFYVKMGFVTALIINSFMIRTLSGVATSRTFNSLTFKEKFPLILSGCISTIGWFGAATAGLFLF